MRLNLVLALAAGLAFAACNDGETDSDTETDVIDTGDDGNNSADRLGVPEEYKFLWNTTDGCTTADGSDGTQIYWHTSDARSFDQGGGTIGFTATETYYWFHGGSGSADCKDVWEITGYYVNVDYGQLGCSGCEEGYFFERKLKDQGCSYLYHMLYAYQEGEQAPDPQVYDGYMLMDTHNVNGGPNENDKMLVVTRDRGPSGWAVNNDYGLAGMSKRVADDSNVIGPPGEYTWVGTACVGGGGGGGT